MTWAREVVHIAWKDVRESRWILAAGVVLSTVVSVLLLRDSTDVSLTSPEPFMWFIAALAIASIVQNDSPATAAAFWTSRPLRASAVLAAKMCVIALIVIGIPVLEEVLALLHYGFDTSGIVDALLDSAPVVIRYTVVFVLLGALSQDIKTFAIALAAIGITFVFWAFLLDNPRGLAAFRAAPWRGPVVMAWYLATVVTIILLYRLRDIRATLWLAMYIIPLGAIEILHFGDGSRQSFIIDAQPANSNAQGQLRLTSAQLVDHANGESELVGVVDAHLGSETPQVELRLDSATITAPNGDSSVVRGTGKSWTLQLGVVPHSNEAVWSIADSERDSMRLSIDARTRGLLGAMRRGTRVRFDVIASTRVKLLSAMELRGGTEQRIGTGMLRIEGVEGAKGVRVSMRRVGLSNSNGNPYEVFAPRIRDFVLVNRARKEAAILGSSGYKIRSRHLLLPGQSMRSAQFVVDGARPGSYVNGIFSDDAWMRDAELLVVHDVPVRARVVHLTYVVP